VRQDIQQQKGNLLLTNDSWLALPAAWNSACITANNPATAIAVHTFYSNAQKMYLLQSV